MDLFKNIPFLIIIVLVVLVFTWQWRKSRKLHKQFKDLPEKERSEQEAKLYLDPIRNAYIRPQSEWLIIISIVGMIFFFVLFGLQKAGIIR